MRTTSHGKPIPFAEFEIAKDQLPLHRRLVELVPIPTRIGCGHTSNTQSVGQVFKTRSLQVAGLTIPDHDLGGRMARLDE